jgi:hypothetical protein
VVWFGYPSHIKRKGGEGRRPSQSDYYLPLCLSVYGERGDTLANIFFYESVDSFYFFVNYVEETV